jgi:hypothetical protein
MFGTTVNPPRPALKVLTVLIDTLLTCNISIAQTIGGEGLLNDTAQTLCANDANDAMTVCENAITGETSTNPRQDGRFGRDVAAPAKLGGGSAGFDFSRVCFNGHTQGSGTCIGTLIRNTGASASASPSTDWACTKDNVTNLIWSLQSEFGDWTYFAQTTLVDATNHSGRCGFNSGWRLPTRRELLGIVHFGKDSPPRIDSDYFPATQSNWYWSNDTYAPDPEKAWVVDFFIDGSTAFWDKNGFPGSPFVRLVRNGS